MIIWKGDKNECSSLYKGFRLKVKKSDSENWKYEGFIDDEKYTNDAYFMDRKEAQDWCEEEVDQQIAFRKLVKDMKCLDKIFKNSNNENTIT